MTYEFRCRSCDERFEVRATLAEKERGLSPHCPQCGSLDVQRVFGAFMVLRAGDDRSGAAGRSNGDGNGSGGCACGGACSCAS